jgi:hypothetical protein
MMAVMYSGEITCKSSSGFAHSSSACGQSSTLSCSVMVVSYIHFLSTLPSGYNAKDEQTLFNTSMNDCDQDHKDSATNS